MNRDIRASDWEAYASDNWSSYRADAIEQLLVVNRVTVLPNSGQGKFQGLPIANAIRAPGGEVNLIE
jgi:hypothetical protein